MLRDLVKDIKKEQTTLDEFVLDRKDIRHFIKKRKLEGQDSNLRFLGYEPSEMS